MHIYTHMSSNLIFCWWALVLFSCLAIVMKAWLNIVKAMLFQPLVFLDILCEWKLSRSYMFYFQFFKWNLHLRFQMLPHLHCHQECMRLPILHLQCPLYGAWGAQDFRGCNLIPLIVFRTGILLFRSIIIHVSDFAQETYDAYKWYWYSDARVTSTILAAWVSRFCSSWLPCLASSTGTENRW